MPAAGRRDGNNGSLAFVGTDGVYRSSSLSTASFGFYLLFTRTESIPNRAQDPNVGGYTVRCVRWKPVFFLPAVGIRRDTAGTLLSQGVAAAYWSSTQGSSTTGYNLNIANTTSAPTNASTKDQAFPIRCVRKPILFSCLLAAIVLLTARSISIGMVLVAATGRLRWRVALAAMSCASISLITCQRTPPEGRVATLFVA